MVVLYNRLSLTQRMMESFLKTTHSPFRLIIIDNHSSDGTVEWLQQFKTEHAQCQGVVKHYFPENYGIAVGRNHGLLLSDQFKDPWLSTLDNDIEFPDNWLEKCLDIVKTNHKFAIGLNFENIPYPIQMVNGKPVQWKREGNLGTACTVFHRKLHETIGFFTTSYGLYSCDDSNWFFRARMAGWNMGYLPQDNQTVHFGVGELDTGEYRTWKDECHKKTVSKFQADCYAYMQGRKSIYHDYTPPTIKTE
jgi:glycosyltransferase involved in cell wall biosynthesis